MEIKKNKWLSLQYFADGGEGAGGTGEGGAQMGAEGHGDADRATGEPNSSNDLSDVIYGIGEDGGSDDASEDPDAEDRGQGEQEDIDAEFEKLIAKDGKFRDVYEKRVQDIISRRLRSVKQESRTARTDAESNAINSVLSELAKKYNVDAADATAVAKAFLEDEDRLYEEAVARGISTDELKRQKANERELEDFRRRDKLEREAQEARQRQTEAKTRYDGWIREGEALKKIYPAFDLAAEAKNGEFVKRLQAGIPMREIYEGMHHADLVKSAMAYTAGKVEKGTADKIRANASRPSEGAARSRAATVHKTNVEDLTGQDIREILKRVESGAKITF